MLITLLATAVVLGVLIFVHELGHFLTAKLVDIEVPRFSIGFGPKVLGFRRGETEYVLSALPLGGYVKMAGMEEMEAIEGGAEQGADARELRPDGTRKAGPRDFESKSLAARTLVISAGVIMNLLFAVIVFALVALGWGVPQVLDAVVGSVTEEYLPEGTEILATIPRGTRITAVGDEAVASFEDVRIALTTLRAGETTIALANAPPMRITIPSDDSARSSLVVALEPMLESPPVLDDVVENGAAGRAGLQKGDRILAAAGTPLSNWQEFVAAIEAHPGEPVVVTVLRDQDTVNLSVTPDASTLAGGREYGRIGVARSLTRLERQSVGVVAAIRYGFSETWRWVAETVDFLVGLFGGQHSARSVGGPILIGQISGQAARAGLETFLNFMALLSVNLAVLNLLPIPVLDGGHLVFLAIEAVRGRALSLRQRMRWSQVGFIIILAIMAFAIGNDLLRWIGL